MTLDLDFVRSQYPVFQHPETAPWAFFENAGGSYVPGQVIERLNYFFKYTKVQPYGLFDSSAAAGEAMEEAYRCVAELLNTDPDQLTFGPSTTMNFYVLAQAFRPDLVLQPCGLQSPACPGPFTPCDFGLRTIRFSALRKPIFRSMRS